MGDDVNLQSVAGETALMYAVSSNYADVVKELLQRGADKNILLHQNEGEKDL